MDHSLSSSAKYIFNQWRSFSPAAELYKCSRCFGLELQYVWNLGMCPEELCGMNMNCHPHHKNGIQAYLAVDATPLQGGIAFFTCMGMRKCFYYQPNFNDLGIHINRLRPTEFEMVNLLIALFIFKTEMLNHKTVRIIVDNNNLRSKNKTQRYALTEAIAAILQWCDNQGCTINELYQSNTSNDKPFMKIADMLSRNKEIRQWVRQKESAELDNSWKNVISSHYTEISHTKRYLNENILACINLMLNDYVYIPESDTTSLECPRFGRMMRYFETLDYFEYVSTVSRRQKVESTPIRSNESEVSVWSVIMTVFLMLLIYYFAF